MPTQKLTALFYQLNDAGMRNEHPQITRSSQTSDEITELLLIYWTSLELIRIYKLYNEIGAKNFNLRKPIFIEVRATRKVHHFVCRSIPKSAVSALPKEEAAFRLKNTLFLVRSRHRWKTPTPKTLNSAPVTNLDPILNAIEHRIKHSIRNFRPVIYTGMTN